MLQAQQAGGDGDTGGGNFQRLGHLQEVGLGRAHLTPDRAQHVGGVDRRDARRRGGSRLWPSRQVVGHTREGGCCTGHGLAGDRLCLLGHGTAGVSTESAAAANVATAVVVSPTMGNAWSHTQGAAESVELRTLHGPRHGNGLHLLNVAAARPPICGLLHLSRKLAKSSRRLHPVTASHTANARTPSSMPRRPPRGIGSAVRRMVTAQGPRSSIGTRAGSHCRPQVESVDAGEDLVEGARLATRT